MRAHVPHVGHATRRGMHGSSLRTHAQAGGRMSVRDMSAQMKQVRSMGSVQGTCMVTGHAAGLHGSHAAGRRGHNTGGLGWMGSAWGQGPLGHAPGMQPLWCTTCTHHGAGRMHAPWYTTHANMGNRMQVLGTP